MSQDDVLCPEKSSGTVSSSNSQSESIWKKAAIAPGSGIKTPPLGADVTVHLKGALSDGTVFEDTRALGSPFKCVLGDGALVKGCEVLVNGMTTGERCALECGPAHAFGIEGCPPLVPPNAVVTFDVELLQWFLWKDVSPCKDGSVVMQTFDFVDVNPTKGVHPNP